MSSIRHILILVCAMFAVTTMAQRRITPVANPENKRPETETPVVKEVKPGETPVRPASVIETHDMEGPCGSLSIPYPEWNITTPLP